MAYMVTTDNSFFIIIAILFRTPMDAGGLKLRMADLGGSVGTNEIGNKIVELVKTSF